MHETFLEMGIPHIALSKEHLDLDDSQMQAQLHHHISNCAETPDLWASIPCTSGSPWQRVNRLKGGAQFIKRHALQVKESKRLFAEFTTNAELVLTRNGTVTFEWPKGCEVGNAQTLNNFSITALNSCQWSLMGALLVLSPLEADQLRKDGA